MNFQPCHSQFQIPTQGLWQLQRFLVDENGGFLGSMQGTASWSTISLNRYLYKEQLIHHSLQGNFHSAYNSYLFDFSGIEPQLFFNESPPRPFVPLSIHWQEYLCGKDCYRVRFHTWNRTRIVWEVECRGPKKNYTSHTELSSQYCLEPIGYLHCHGGERYQAPRQGHLDKGRTASIKLLPQQNFEQALTDLEGFERLWILFIFNRNQGWKPKVMPPRGRFKRGLFATRSPHRPNPIGLSSVRLIDKPTGLTLQIAEHDLLDGTPILDIKPYLPEADAFPDASIGWLENLSSTEYNLSWQPKPLLASRWILEQGGPNLELELSSYLSTNPYPYPGRRITQQADSLFCCAWKSWRITYHVKEKQITILSIDTGYTTEALQQNKDQWKDLELHKQFVRTQTPFPPDCTLNPD